MLITVESDKKMCTYTFDDCQGALKVRVIHNFMLLCTQNESTVEDKEIESLVSPVIPVAAEQLLCTGETQRFLDLHKHSEVEGKLN